MSFFRVSFGIISRADGGSAKRRSAYQRCANEDPFDFSDKADELQHSEVMLPPGASQDLADPVSLWTAAEAAEKRVDAQLARTFEIAIPHEVPEHLRNQFAREMLAPLVQDHGFAVEWSRHKADHLFEQSGTENDHIHAVVSLRQLEPGGFSAKKDRGFNSLMMARNGRDMRETFEKRMNAFFEHHNIEAKVSAGRKPEELKTPVIGKGTIREIQRKKTDDNKIIPQALSPKARGFIIERHQKRAAIERYRRTKNEVENIRHENNRDVRRKSVESENSREHRNKPAAGEKNHRIPESHQSAGRTGSRSAPSEPIGRAAPAGGIEPGRIQPATPSSGKQPVANNINLKQLQRLITGKQKNGAMHTARAFQDVSSSISRVPEVIPDASQDGAAALRAATASLANTFRM